MIRALPLLALLLVVPVAARAVVADARGQFLVGHWYGEEQPEDPNVFWLASFWPDGRFEAMFRTCHKDKAVDERDDGTWTYRNGVARVTSTRVDGHPILAIEDYRTLSYDGRKHVYRHLRTNFVFTAVRVAADFTLPSCALSS